MPRNRVYKCSTCSRSHERPTGKHCQWVDAEQATQPNTAEQQPQTQSIELANAVVALTATVAEMGRRFSTMEERMESREAAEATGGQSESDEEVPTTPPNLQERGDVPSLQELRRNYAVGREVNRRLAELENEEEAAAASGLTSSRPRGKRSGAARTVRDTIINDIDWPHFHIYTAPGEEPMTFQRLSLQEFVYGFMHMIDQPDSRLDRQIMWDILKGMMEDATEYPWHNVRNFYWVVGSHVENDRLRWDDAEPIQKLRLKHAQKHDPSPTKQQAKPTEKLRYCAPYQKGECTEKADHAGQKHMCAFCYRVKGSTYSHPESDCRRKTGELPKNGKGGE